MLRTLICVALGLACIEARAQTTEREYDWAAPSNPQPKRERSKPSSSKSTAAPKAKPEKTSTPAPPPRDPDLARCDEFKKRYEQVIREEMRGGDPVRMQRLAEERKRIYQEELRAGC